MSTQANNDYSAMIELHQLRTEVEQKSNLLVTALKSAGDQATRAERAEANVRILRAACESVAEEWSRNHDANPFAAGNRMMRLADTVLATTEDTP